MVGVGDLDLAGDFFSLDSERSLDDRRLLLFLSGDFDLDLDLDLDLSPEADRDFFSLEGDRLSLRGLFRESFRDRSFDLLLDLDLDFLDLDVDLDLLLRFLEPRSGDLDLERDLTTTRFEHYLGKIIIVLKIHARFFKSRLLDLQYLEVLVSYQIGD